MNAVFKFLSVAAAAILPTIASASVETLSSSCSSNLVVSLENGYDASCDGDFSFDSGTLRNDVAIKLTSLGALNIHSNVSLIAPLIELTSTMISISSGAVLDAGYIGMPIYASEVNLLYMIEPKQSLIVSQVPEPSNLSMFAIGLLGIALIARRTANNH